MITKEQIIEENISIQCLINQIISDLVSARINKDIEKEEKCIRSMESLLVGIDQHLQVVEDFFNDLQQ